MTAQNWDACFAETERWEGWHKFTVTPHDPGGATYCGLTQASYDAWRKRQGQPQQDVRHASDDEIEQIFRFSYWTPVHGNDLWAGLDMECFDISINMGPVEATKILQSALKVTPDGWFGLETLNAVQGCTDKKALLYAVHLGRLGFWRRLTNWKWFGGGWTNRENDVYARAQAMLQA